MITDDTIDATTAKCWCIFSEEEFKTQLKRYSTGKNKEVDESLGGILAGFSYYAGLAMTAMSVVGLVGPYISNLMKKMKHTKDKSIAKVEFEADGTDYVAEFSLVDMKWILTSASSVNTQDTISFFKTKFFEGFLKGCAKNIMPVVENEKVILENLDKIGDKNTRQFLDEFFQNKDRIMTNMFEVKYLT